MAVDVIVKRLVAAYWSSYRRRKKINKNKIKNKNKNKTKKKIVKN